MESIKRIYKATDSLEDRIAELESFEQGIRNQMADLKVLRQHIGNALTYDEHPTPEVLAA